MIDNLSTKAFQQSSHDMQHRGERCKNLRWILCVCLHSGTPLWVVTRGNSRCCLHSAAQWHTQSTMIDTLSTRAFQQSSHDMQRRGERCKNLRWIFCVCLHSGTPLWVVTGGNSRCCLHSAAQWHTQSTMIDTLSTRAFSNPAMTCNVAANAAKTSGGYCVCACIAAHPCGW